MPVVLKVNTRKELKLYAKSAIFHYSNSFSFSQSCKIKGPMFFFLYVIYNFNNETFLIAVFSLVQWHDCVCYRRNVIMKFYIW